MVERNNRWTEPSSAGKDPCGGEKEKERNNRNEEDIACHKIIRGSP